MKFRDHTDKRTHPARLQSLLDAVKTKALRTLVVEATGNCNLKCSFCDLHSGRSQNVEHFKGNMTFEMFERIVSQIKEADFILNMLQYIGHGEPLMNKLLPKFARHARVSGVCKSQKIITNGTLLTKEYLMELVDSGISCIEVSLDAASPERYRAIKGKDLYHKVYRNLCDAIDFASSSNAFDLVIKTAVPHPDQKYGVEQSDLDAVMKTMGEMAKSSPRVIIKGVPIVTFSDAVQEKGTEYREICEIPFYMLMVLFDGDVVACCSDALRQLPVGNLKTQTMAEIIAGDSLRHIRKCHLSHQQDSIPLCLYCSNRPSTNVEPIAEELMQLI